MVGWTKFFEEEKNEKTPQKRMSIRNKNLWVDMKLQFLELVDCFQVERLAEMFDKKYLDLLKCSMNIMSKYDRLAVQYGYKKADKKASKRSSKAVTPSKKKVSNAAPDI